MPPTIKNWIENICGVKALCFTPKNFGFRLLLTRNLNQDLVENFLGKLGSIGVYKFISDLDLNNLHSVFSSSRNYEEYGDEILNNLRSFLEIEYAQKVNDLNVEVPTLTSVVDEPSSSGHVYINVSCAKIF